MTYEEAKKVLKWALSLLDGHHYISDSYGTIDPTAKTTAFGMAIGAIDKALAMQWVPVSERLPEADFEEYFRINGEYPHYLVKIREGVTAAILDFDGENWTDDYYTPYNVTHWMPLPEPPKEENK